MRAEVLSYSRARGLLVASRWKVLVFRRQRPLNADHSRDRRSKYGMVAADIDLLTGLTLAGERNVDGGYDANRQI
jgi:hypothetical protein